MPSWCGRDEDRSVWARVGARGPSQVAGLGKDAAYRRVSHASKYVKRCNTIAWDVPTRDFNSDDCLRAKEHLGRPLPSCSQQLLL